MPDLKADAAKLCTACATISKADVTVCSTRGCSSTSLRPVRQLKKVRGDEIAGCRVCGGRGAGTVRIFETGSEASGAVIATSLYQRIPAGAGDEDFAKPGEGRKLLMFSDSRQAAAYFAPYLEDSYAKLQRRRLLSLGLASAHTDLEPASISDVVHEATRHANSVGHFRPGLTAQEQAREVAPWVMAEAVAMDDRISLEGLGVVRVVVRIDPDQPLPPPLMAEGMTREEAWCFVQELLRTLRHQGAITMPDNVPPNHEIFLPRLGPIHARLEGPEAKRKVLAWLPGRGTNRRIDYTSKVLESLGASTDPRSFLEGIWRWLTSPGVGLLRAETVRNLGAVARIDHELVRFELTTETHPVYRCTVCRRISPFSVRQVCPALKCAGRLELMSPSSLGDANHYRTVYRSMHPVPLAAQEHTAQWTSTEAARVQHRFIHGDVNALSCSTTFELGVDVGELQAVLLRNMPPSTANYVQRAGRAGRRTGSAALVVTYAQRRSHDLAKYADPRGMMSGAIRAPYVPLVNERIDRRHAHSVALAAFFRWFFDATKTISRTAGDFFLRDEPASKPPVSHVEGFLTPVPPDIRESLGRVLPSEVHEAIGLDSGEWVSVLVNLLDTVGAELASDVGALEALRDDAADARKYALANGYEKVIATLRKRDLLGFLANRNVLPKYGFPVDSVELRTNYSLAAHQVGARLQLSRDLSQAIYEYAPDSAVVAGGQLWTSRGLYRLPGRALQEFSYLVCERCGGFRQAPGEVDRSCPVCGHATSRSARTLTVPEFGFVAGREPSRPGIRPPQRSWSGAVHVLKESEEAKTRTIDLLHGQLKTTVGPRGRLVAVADGPGGAGFWVCDWCGYGAARSQHPRKMPTHNHLLKNTPCAGRGRLLDLAHSYETDLLRIDFVPSGLVGNDSSHKSLLYALLESACDTLEISRGDIGGTLLPTGQSTWALMLFDAVPGGAGHVLMVEQELKRILSAALRRVSACECGEETSCYGCLRSYGNQRDHDLLSRGSAKRALEQLVEPADISANTPASSKEDSLLEQIRASGLAPPTIGHETDEGIPISVSWPSRRIAVDLDLEPSDQADLVSAGWTVVPIEITAIQRSLGPEMAEPHDCQSTR